MKCLSGRQPWFWALFHGKDIENRKKPTWHRGQLLIHASKGKYSKAEWVQVEEFCRKRGVIVPSKKELVFGAIIGVVEITDCKWGGSTDLPTWGMPNQYHYYLENPQIFQSPVPCLGQLSMWDIPQIDEKVCQQLVDGTVRALSEAISGQRKREYRQLSLF